jgi:hypothetical protein
MFYQVFTCEAPALPELAGVFGILCAMAFFSGPLAAILCVLRASPLKAFSLPSDGEDPARSDTGEGQARGDTGEGREPGKHPDIPSGPASRPSPAARPERAARAKTSSEPLLLDQTLPVWRYDPLDPPLERLRKKADRFSGRGDFVAAERSWGLLRSRLAFPRGPGGEMEGAALSRVARYRMLRHDYDGALEDADEALALMSFGEDPEECLFAQETLLWSGFEKKPSAEHLFLFLTVAKIAKEILGKGSLPRRRAEGRIASIALLTGNYFLACEQYRRLLEQDTLRLGRTHPETRLTRDMFAAAMGFRGDIDAYVHLSLDSARACEEALGPRHPETLAARRRAAESRVRAGDLSGSVSALRLVLADSEAWLGESSPETLSLKGRLGSLLISMRPEYLTEALDFLNAARKGLSGLPGADGQDGLAAEANLGIGLWMAGEEKTGRHFLKETSKTLEKLLGKGNPETGIVNRALRNLQNAKAAKAARKALASLPVSPSPESPESPAAASSDTPAAASLGPSGSPSPAPSGSRSPDPAGSAGREASDTRDTRGLVSRATIGTSGLDYSGCWPEIIMRRDTARIAEFLRSGPVFPEDCPEAGQNSGCPMLPAEEREPDTAGDEDGSGPDDGSLDGPKGD